MFPNHFYDVNASRPWNQDSQTSPNPEEHYMSAGSSSFSSSDDQYDTAPNSPNFQEQFERLSVVDTQDSPLSRLQDLGEVFVRGESSRTRDMARGSSGLSTTNLNKYVKEAYKNLRFYHGTNQSGVDSIRASGMDIRRKQGGTTALALRESERNSGSMLRNARSYNYLTSVKRAARSYAGPASSVSSRTWQRKQGADGIPKLARVFQTSDVPSLEKDTDFPPVSIPLVGGFINRRMNPLYRTQENIPASAVRQGHGSERYSHEILSAMQSYIQRKHRVLIDLQTIHVTLVGGVESDSDDDFPSR